MVHTCTPTIDSNEPMIYQIMVKGQLRQQWGDWFGVTISLVGNDTLLTCVVVDQAALYGLLKKVRNVGLPLLSVNRDTTGD